MLVLEGGKNLPKMEAGQFMMVRIDKSTKTFLRRPFSILCADHSKGVITILVRKAGAGSASLFDYSSGDTLNAIIPLGTGFTLPEAGSRERILVVGGGVGIAPLFFLAGILIGKGLSVDFLAGAKTGKDILLADRLSAITELHIATEDGSEGYKGLVTNHPLLEREYDRLYACGPRAMLQALIKHVGRKIPFCEVSLENMMACGVGACLCCTEKLSEGRNACVCKEGPVFNVKELPWCR
jgi:dihydroorotate dehydrogenase electron transfer subunit